nr:MAG TPA: hypothetical protein [Caudoviricetes sp.]DAJ41849.1 MAG TPA: hypothetical protein [Bacteriophage sp.]
MPFVCVSPIIYLQGTAMPERKRKENCYVCF